MPDPTRPAVLDTIAFTRGGGALGQLIAEFDWSRTELGPIGGWPSHVRVATSLMLRSTVPIVMLWGTTGVMVYNDAYAGFAGQRHPRLLGSKVREGWPEVADFNDHVMRVGLAGGTLSYQDQELTLHRNGRAEQVFMNLDYSPLLDEAGQPVGVMAIVVETSAKVQAERLLSGERERFSQLFEQAPGFMAMLEGPEHRIALANPSYQRLMGGRGVLGRTVAEAVPDVAEQGYLAMLDEVRASGQARSAYGARFLMRATHDGPAQERYLDFVLQPILDRAGGVAGIFVEGADVTGRVASEQSRKRLELLADRLRNLSDAGDVALAAAEMLGESLGASRVGYGSIDHDAEAMRVARDWTAPGVESLAGETRLRDYGDFVDSLKRNEFIAINDVRHDPRTRAAAAALEGRAARAFVNVPVLEHGRLVAVLYVNAADPGDWSLEQMAFVREVAERTRSAFARAEGEAALRASEARLREVNETLEAKVEARGRALVEIEAQFRQAQKMEALGQLTGGIAHDFNNLLHGMGSSLEILERKLQAGHTKDLERYIGMAQRAMRKAASLTQRLLAFSRRQTLDPRPTDVNALIAGLVDLVRSTVGPGITVELQADPELWPTCVDASQLENALLNLCINARDAMHEGGGLLILSTANLHIDPEAALPLALQPGPHIRIAVSDTGTGMTPEVIGRVFDPFFTTKPLGEGTGLGLSMVYGFVRQSGGQVQVLSTPGQGTTMRLYLLRHEGAPEPATPAALRHAGPPGRQAVVLLVEDEATIRTLLGEELREAGYHVLAAPTGPEGLDILRAEPTIDLLITDVGLPGGMNGKQVADEARRLRPGLRVLFITGYAEQAAVGEGLPGPGTALVTKPFEFAELAEKARKLLA